MGIDFSELRETIKLNSSEIEHNLALTNEYIVDDFMDILGYNKRRNKNVKRMINEPVDWVVLNEDESNRLAVKVYPYGENIEDTTDLIEYCKESLVDVAVVTNGDYTEILKVDNDHNMVMIGTVNLASELTDEDEELLGLISNSRYDKDKLDSLIKSNSNSNNTELISEINRLRAENKELRAENEELRAENEELKANSGNSNDIQNKIDAYKKKIQDLALESADYKLEVEKLKEELKKADNRLNNISDIKMDKAKELLNIIEDNKSLPRTYVAVVNTKLIQKDDIKKFIGSVFDELYNIKKYDASRYIFDGDVIGIEEIADDSDEIADMLLGSTKRGYKIDTLGLNEDALLNKLREVFSNFSDVQFLCKKIGTLNLNTDNKEAKPVETVETKKVEDTEHAETVETKKVEDTEHAETVETKKVEDTEHAETVETKKVEDTAVESLDSDEEENKENEVNFENEEDSIVMMDEEGEVNFEGEDNDEDSDKDYIVIEDEISDGDTDNKDYIVIEDEINDEDEVEDGNNEVGDKVNFEDENNNEDNDNEEDEFRLDDIEEDEEDEENEENEWEDEELDINENHKYASTMDDIFENESDEFENNSDEFIDTTICISLSQYHEYVGNNPDVEELRSLRCICGNVNNSSMIYAIDLNDQLDSYDKILCKAIDALLAIEMDNNNVNIIHKIRTTDLSAISDKFKLQTVEYRGYTRINGTRFIIDGLESIKDIADVLIDLAYGLDIDTANVFMFFDGSVVNQDTADKLYGDYSAINSPTNTEYDGREEYEGIAVVKGNIHNNIITTKNSLYAHKCILGNVEAVKTNYMAKRVINNDDFNSVLAAIVDEASNNTATTNVESVGYVLGENYLLMSYSEDKVSSNHSSIIAGNRTVYVSNIEEWQKTLAIIKTHTALLGNTSIAVKTRVNIEAIDFFINRYYVVEPSLRLAVESFTKYIRSCVKS